MSWWSVATATILGAGLGLVLSIVATNAVGAEPSPGAAWLVVVAAAGLVAAIAVGALSRIRRRRDTVTGSLGVTWLAIARTAILGGAVIVGLATAYGLTAVDSWPAPLARSRAIESAAVAGAALVLGGAGRWLERILWRDSGGSASRGGDPGASPPSMTA